MAAGRLGRTRDERAIDSFIRALRDHKDERAIRKLAVEKLGRSGNPRAVESLIRTLESDPNPVVRLHAAKALGRLGDKRATDPLRKALKDEAFVSKKIGGKWISVKGVSEAAAKALKELDVPEEPGKPNDALEADTTAIEIGPQNATACHNRALENSA